MALFNIQPRSVISDVPVALPPPINYPATGSAFGAAGFGGDRRAITVVDLNGDGFLDIFLHPSYNQYGPVLAPVVLINDGSGRFSNGTAGVFRTLPFMEHSNGVFFRDFNRDGRLDMFVVDQGLEISTGTPGIFAGASNRLYLQNVAGVFESVTLPNNAPAFNHVSSVSDMNGDGNLDVVITRLYDIDSQGTFFYFGDGRGGFTFSTAGLAPEIRYALTSTKFNPQTGDIQYSGTNGTADLDNDGRVDLITGSYLLPDRLSRLQTVRVFQQQASGDFVQKWSGAQPEALKALAGVLGVSGIEAADLDGDGLQDLLVYWEGGGGANAIEILKNMGNSQFSDVTLDWLGSYLYRTFALDSTGGFQQGYTAAKFQDVNRDGTPDLVLSNFGATLAHVTGGLPTGAFLYLNDGTGHLRAAVPSVQDRVLGTSEFGALTGTANNPLGIPLVFDADNDGTTDQVFIGTFLGLDQTTFPYRVTKLHIVTLLADQTGHVYRANDTDDYLVGSSGRDLFFSGRGWDVLAGAGGIDTAVYHGGRAEYAVASAAGSSVVQDQRLGRDGTDRLSSVERLHFTDVSVALDDAGIKTAKILGAVFGEGFVQNQAFVGIGLALFDSGMSYEQIAGLAAANGFFAQLAGSHSNRDFVSYIYRNVVGTAPSSAELEFFVGLLDSGQHTQATLAVLAAETDLNQQNINIVGLQQNGVEYV